MPGWIHGIRQLIRFVFQGDMGRRALPIINFQVNCLPPGKIFALTLADVDINP